MNGEPAWPAFVRFSTPVGSMIAGAALGLQAVALLARSPARRPMFWCGLAIAFAACVNASDTPASFAVALWVLGGLAMVLAALGLSGLLCAAGLGGGDRAPVDRQLCRRLYEWAQTYPAVRAYLGQVNAMMRPVTMMDSRAAERYVAETKGREREAAERLACVNLQSLLEQRAYAGEFGHRAPTKN